MLRWTTRTRTRWLIVAGVALVFVIAYAAFVAGTAVDGVINVDARVHSTILTVLSDTIVSSVVLVGGAHLILRLARSVLAEFAAARKQREGIEELLRRIDGKLGGQGLAAALKIPTGEFQRVNGTAAQPTLRTAVPVVAVAHIDQEGRELARRLNRHLRPADDS